jgi:metal-responsive CopG/Arc/MetJ family transcriptional regulator
MEQVTIEFDEADVAAIDEMRERTGQSREATVRELLDAWLDQRREGPEY